VLKLGSGGATQGLEARDDRALDAAIFAPVDNPLGAADEAAVGVAAALEGEIVAVGAGGALGEPVVVRGYGGGYVVFVDLYAVLGGEITGDVPGLHLHAEKLHVVLINAVAEAGVAKFVEQSEASVVGPDAAGVVSDSPGVGGPHKEFAGNKRLISEIFEKIQDSPSLICFVIIISLGSVLGRA
jgi:hypothetical protein